MGGCPFIDDNFPFIDYHHAREMGDFPFIDHQHVREMVGCPFIDHHQN